MDQVVKGLTATKRRLKFAFANVQECIDVMIGGTDMLKLRSGKKTPYKRTFFLDLEGGRIRWEPSVKALDKSRILIDSIDEVREGHQSDVFRLRRGLYSPNCCLSIVYGSQQEQLDLVAPSELKASQWILGLKSLVKKSAGSDKVHKRQNARDQWLKETFEAADKNGDGTLSLDEILKLMNKLNVGLGSSQVRRLFLASDTDTEGDSANALDFEEFQNFYKTVSTRTELYYLMMRYSTSGEEYLTVEDLQTFLQTEQMMVVTWGDCERIIRRYEPTSTGQQDMWLGIDGLTQYLVGPEGDIFNPDHKPVHQDMDHPLSHYFINSSHNTYLSGDQLQSKSSVDMYIKALKLGCRCVEIDCWNGSDGEPVVYHGHTLTSKVKFYEVVVAINKYAFVTSPYPVILSIENHCGVDQQLTMAKYMQQIFREKLLMERIDPNSRHLPSPEQLKYKILIKNQKLEEEDIEEGWVTDEDEADEMEDEHKAFCKSSLRSFSDPPEGTRSGSARLRTAGSDPDLRTGAKDNSGFVRRARSPSASSTLKKSQDAPNKKANTVGTPRERQFSLPSARLSATLNPRSFGSKGRSRSLGTEDDMQDIIDLQPRRKVKLARALSQLVVYTKSVRFRGFCDSQANVKWWEMSSFSEGKAQRCSIERRASRFVMHNRKQLSRIYPAGYRIDSSNYNPQEMWNCGCQIVALNYQKEDKAMQLNRARFRVNGNCGYVLKPAAMRDDHFHFNPYCKGIVYNVAPVVLSLKMISGQQFPKPKGVEKGEIIDPYVIVEIIGLPSDCAVERTKVVDDNGFNPVWNETFTFNMVMPELALIRFVVMDKDVVSDDYIGQATFPVSSLLEGYRHIHLEGEGIEMSTLFVHIIKRWSVQGFQTENHSFLSGILRKFRKSKVPGEVAKQQQSDVLLLRQRKIGSLWVHQRKPVQPHIAAPSVAVSDVQEEEETRTDEEEITWSRQTPSRDELTLPRENGHFRGVPSRLEEIVQDSFDSVVSSKASSTEREVSPSSVEVELESDATSRSSRQLSPASIEVKVD